MYKKGRVNSNSRIISTDEDTSLRIESSAIINLRGVSTKLNKYIIVCIRNIILRIRNIIVHIRNIIVRIRNTIVLICNIIVRIRNIILRIRNINIRFPFEH